MRIRLYIASFLCGLLALCTAIAGKRKNMAFIDSLRQFGLTDSEIRVYLYLLALEEISTYRTARPDIRSAEAVRKYIAANTAARCPSCERWYLSEIQVCPLDGKTTREITHATLEQLVAIWEQFRMEFQQSYRDIRAQPLSRVSTIRMHYYHSGHSREG